MLHYKSKTLNRALPYGIDLVDEPSHFLVSGVANRPVSFSLLPLITMTIYNKRNEGLWRNQLLLDTTFQKSYSNDSIAKFTQHRERDS